MASEPASRPSPSLKGGYSIVAIFIGIFLIVVAIIVVNAGAKLPYSRLLIYSGVAALFAGIGSTAAVSYELKPAGQAGTAGGAAAIAILLCWTIGVDPPPRLSMTYYINFPGTSAERSPTDLTATVEIFGGADAAPEKTQHVPVARAPGGSALKLTVVDVSSEAHIVIRLHSNKEQKDWESASILPTEGFMNLNEAQQ